MTAITFIRQGQNLLWGSFENVFFSFYHLYIITNKYNNRFEHTFLLIPEKNDTCPEYDAIGSQQAKVLAWECIEKMVPLEGIFNEIPSKNQLEL